ncbi:MAG: lipoprotein [Burkholderiaceae bacterium]|nr:lipoprotein [Burkholderiaceae bacterium]
MLKLLQILFRPLSLAACAVGLGLALAACGQKGALYLPTGPEAAQRATLPQVLSPVQPSPTAATVPAAAASAPIR